MRSDRGPRWDHDRRPRPRRAPDGRARRRDAATVGLGIALTLIVGWDGAILWRCLRPLIVLVATLVALWLGHRDKPAVRGLAALLSGLVGTSTGIGIGLMHVAKSDVNVVAVAGLVALGAGLYLLVAGAALLLRATPGWWRLLAVPVAYMALQFVVMPCSVAIYASNVPRIGLDHATPADRGLSYHDVTLTTSDNVHLAAWYVPARNGAALVLLHGSGSTRTSVLDHAAVLARHGYGVLMVDARGHGQSGGDAQDFGWWGDIDTSSAVSWLATQPQVRAGRIGVMGISMGGEEAIGAAGADLRIRAVVTEGALWRGAMDDGWLARDFAGYVDRGMLRVQTALTGLLTAAPTPPSLASSLQATAPRPVLLIAGKPEIRGDRVLRDASPTNVELWEMPDTGHTAGLATHPEAWEARVIAFLDGSLGGR